MRKLEKSGQRIRPPSSAATQATSSTVDTPNSADGSDVVMAEMTVEEAIDMDPETESEEDAEEDVNMESGVPLPDVDSLAGMNNPMDLGADTPARDPRRRFSNGSQCVWDPHEPAEKYRGETLVDEA